MRSATSHGSEPKEEVLLVAVPVSCQNRRRQVESGSAGELSRQRQHSADLAARVHELEDMLSRRTDQISAWKNESQGWKRRYHRARQRVHDARMSVGAELVYVRDKLEAGQQDNQAIGSRQDTDTPELSTLRHENTQLRQDLNQAHQHVHAMRIEQDKYSEQLAAIYEDNLQFEQALRQIQMKSELMFRVFRDWHTVTGWLHQWTHGQGRNPEEQQVIGFWAWMRDRHPEIIHKHCIDTSFEEELTALQNQTTHEEHRGGSGDSIGVDDQH